MQKKCIIAITIISMILSVACQNFVPVMAASATGNTDSYLLYDGTSIETVYIGPNGTTAATSSNISSELYKTKQAAYVGDLSTEGNYITFDVESLNLDLSSYSYINAWVYLTKDDCLRWTYTYDDNGTSKKANNYFPGKNVFAEKSGWYLYSYKLVQQYGEPIKFSLYNSKDASHPDYVSGNIYVDCVWVSKNSPAASVEYGGSSLKDGVPVRTDVGTISIEASGIQAHPNAKSIVDVSPDVAFDVSCINNKLNIQLNTLDYDTDYTISVSEGFYDEFGIPFGTTTLNFHTLREGENIPPTVEFVSPVLNSRFYPGDVITLKASAFDDDGKIDYVEFYQNDVLIDGSRQTELVDGFYTFDWSDTNSEGTYALKAVAYDKAGAFSESEIISIVVMDYKTPQIQADIPEYLYSNIVGWQKEEKLSVSVVATDEDDNISKVEIFVDDALLHTETQSPKSFIWTCETILDIGNHIVKSVVTDEDGLYSETSSSVEVMKLGAKTPALIKTTLKPEEWKKTGKSEVLSGTLSSDSSIKGLVIKSDNPANPDTTYLQKGVSSNISNKMWVAVLQIACDDNEHDRVISLLGSSELEILKFGEDSKIYCDTKDTSLTYIPGKVYDVKLIYDSRTSSLTCMLDNSPLYTGKKVSANEYKDGASVKVSHTGKKDKLGEICISSFGIYELGEAAETVSANIYDESNQLIDNLNNVPVYAEKISVAVDGGIDLTTLDGVSLRKKEDGKNISVTTSGGYVLINEMLESATVYELVIGSTVTSSNGIGYCGDKVIEFTTKMGDVFPKSETAAFKSGGNILDSLNTSVTEVTFELKLDNNSNIDKPVKVIAVLYTGNKAKVFETPVTLTANTPSQPAVVNMTDLLVSQDSYIECFVTDSLEEMSFLTDKIFKLN